jgi:microsomal epoxide hydrolase
MTVDVHEAQTFSTHAVGPLMCVVVVHIHNIASLLFSSSTLLSTLQQEIRKSATMPFNTVPSKASLKPEPFQANVPDMQLQTFRHLIALGVIGPRTYENQVAEPKDFTSFGIKRSWLVDTVEEWQNNYDWRKTEARINRLPNFTAEIEEEGFKFKVHFAALFSKRSDAVPLLLSHGWPGSFLEFLGVLEHLSSKYDENNLPYHVIVPSLPGYCYSNGPPLDRNFTVQDLSRVLDKLMHGLGFGDGYVAQGGDIGSFVTRVLAVTSPACKAAHINLCIGVFPDEEERKKLDEKGQKVR